MTNAGKMVSGVLKYPKKKRRSLGISKNIYNQYMYKRPQSLLYNETIFFSN